MNFGGSRLGFWFRPTDRAIRSKKVLVFYDPLTYGPGGNPDYYNYDVSPQFTVWPVLQARETALGFQPSLCTSFAALSAINLDEYSHIWDIGYATPYYTNPNNPAAQLTSFLQRGGAMFMLGENYYFAERDNTIDTFVNSLGGGPATYWPNAAYYTAISATVQPEFLIANNNNSITFNAPNVFETYGSATPIAIASGVPYPTAVCWKTGSLSSAPAGAIVSVLDINFFAGGDYNPDFIDNISLILNQR